MTEGHGEPAPDGATHEDAALCSSKGCTNPAVWDLLWNNPKIHTPERRKIWMACDTHRPSLSDFLGARQFLKDVVPHGSGPVDEGPNVPSAADR